MAYDDRYGERGEWRGGGNDRERGQQGRERGERGYGRDDRDPGAHVDYYRGGDYGQRRTGPEGGFEDRGDYRRSERHAEQGRSYGGGQGGERDQRRYEQQGDDDQGGYARSGGYGGVNQGMGAYGGNRGSGYGTDDAAGYSTGGAEGPGYDPNFGGPRFDRLDVGSIGTHGAHPVASPYGSAQTGTAGGYGGGSSARSRAILEQARGRQQGQGSRQSRGQGQSQQQASHHHDPHYSGWRQRQIETFDRDYDEYRRENASRFESEFGSWRQKRGEQRSSLGRVAEHMEVVGSDDAHVGTVDKVKGDRIILTKSDPDAEGHHHSIPCGWLDSVDDKVRLNKTADAAKQAWRDEETNRALFEEQDSGSDGPHILDRSFSGTYDRGDR